MTWIGFAPDAGTYWVPAVVLFSSLSFLLPCMHSRALSYLCCLHLQIVQDLRLMLGCSVNRVRLHFLSHHPSVRQRPTRT